jgi:hypothetical protein
MRFTERELTLLRGAEHVRGQALAQHAGRVDLRAALTLSRAGHKLRGASAGPALVFEEPELRAVVEAVRFARDEVQYAAGSQVGAADARARIVLEAFPELVERGLWRGYGLSRELDELAQRLDLALRST